jgi:hypothetical protein
VVGVDVNEPRLNLDAVITLRECEIRTTGEGVELASVVMRSAARLSFEGEPLDIARP